MVGVIGRGLTAIGWGAADLGPEHCPKQDEDHDKHRLRDRILVWVEVRATSACDDLRPVGTSRHGLCTVARSHRTLRCTRRAHLRQTAGRGARTCGITVATPASSWVGGAP